MSDKLVFVLDVEKSKVRLRTFAEGLFARLAHDLELGCRDITGRAERTNVEPENEDDVTSGAVSVTIEVPIHRIDVNGTLKDDRVDPNGLSSSDREDCLSKMRKDVFHTPSPSAPKAAPKTAKDAVVRVEATFENGRAKVRITPPNGKTVERSTAVRVSREDASATQNFVRAQGTFSISLSAIGSDTVKGPMNAFRVKDNVEVLFDVVWKPA